MDISFQKHQNGLKFIIGKVWRYDLF